MKKTLLVLAASTALTASIGFPAWSAMPMSALQTAGQTTPAAIADEAGEPIRLVSDRHDRDHHKKSWWRRLTGDDDDHEYGRDDDDDDDEGGSRAQMNPAPAGTVAPPKNGLFGNGDRPKAQVN